MRYFKFFIYIFLAFLPAACQKPMETLSVSPETVTVSQSMGRGSFMVVTPGDWTAELKPDAEEWCRISPERGTGNTTVKVICNPNPGESSRETEVLVKTASGSGVCIVKIIQPETVLSLPSEPVIVNASGDAVSMTLSISDASASWTIQFPQDLTVTPDKGKGTSEITISATPNPKNKPRHFSIGVTCGESSGNIDVEQMPGANHYPTAPVPVRPADGATDIYLIPTFQWERSSDEDYDRLQYSIELSVNGTEWTSYGKTEGLSITLDKPLEANTAYFWRIVASDGIDEVPGKIHTFTTGEKSIHPDGEVYRYDENMFDGPIPLIFTGDGFISEDYESGGDFDVKVDQGIEHFFSVEPYKSLKSYFSVYKVAAYSEERGASRWNEQAGDYEKKVNTRFDTRYYGNGYNSTYMTCNTGLVYTYAKKTGITQETLNKTIVILVVNDPVYSGTCWMEYGGSAVAIVPACGNSDSPYTYRATMVHEAGGHGFGKLADEYTFSDSPASPSDKNNIESQYNLYGWSPNIDTRGKENCKWKHFFGVPEYESVGYIEDRTQYASGVYRPELNSVMRNMTMAHIYYNGPSRENIVKRIYNAAGEEYSFEKFIALDKGNQRKPAAGMAAEEIPSYLERPTAHTSPQIIHR